MNSDTQTLTDAHGFRLWQMLVVVFAMGAVLSVSLGQAGVHAPQHDEDYAEKARQAFLAQPLPSQLRTPTRQDPLMASIEAVPTEFVSSLGIHRETEMTLNVYEPDQVY